MSAAQENYAGGVGTRSQLWHAAFSLWRHHPLFGVGAGNFEFEIGTVGPKNIRTHANSLYFQTLAEQGVVGFCAMLWLTIKSVQSVWQSGVASNPLVVGALGASVALALHQTVDLLVFFPKIGGWWFVVLGIGIAAQSLNRPNELPAAA